MPLFTKKILIIIAVAFVVFGVSSPVITYAAVPVFETNPTVAGIVPQNFYEFYFKLAVQALKRKLLDMVVDQITSWIQGGGKPKFVSDWSGFLKDAADQAAGAYLNSLTEGQFCSAINKQTVLNTIPVARFSGPQNTCSLSLQGRNWQNFFTDFTNGGWTSWIQLNTQPQNNIFGQYALTYDNYMMQRTAAQQAALAEAQAGRGFLSVSKCIQYEEDEFGNPTSNCIRSQIVTPGAVVGDLASKAVGSDIDFIVNTEDLAAYVSAITNAVLNRLFSEGLTALRSSSQSAPAGGGSLPNYGNAAGACAGLAGTSGYTACLTAIQGGQNVLSFQSNFLSSQIQQVITLKTQTRDTKQNTSNVLSVSISTLNQLRVCQTARQITFNQIILKTAISDKNNIDGVIITLSGQIADLTNRFNAAQDIINADQFGALYNGVNPDTERTSLSAAQSETAQKQTDLLSYQSQLQACQGAPSSQGDNQ